MTKPHVLAYYKDGNVEVAYCKVCSAEGLKLLEDCPQKIVNSYSSDQRRMVDYLGLSPWEPKDWPIDIINRLIELEHREGHSRLIEEIRKLTIKTS